MSQNQNETLWDKVSESQGTVFVASSKLQAFGALLERQSEDCEGYTELHGLGVALRELGDDLLQVWRELNPANLFPKKPRPRRGGSVSKKGREG